jgi:hypothetical protein
MTAGNCSEVYGTWLVHKPKYEEIIDHMRERKKNKSQTLR